ncbi:MAG: PAS domain S-box protein [Deltaproteobacteria bacterium]|nr:PAS domain S-box protein [Deltaproteobacteria bacterium]
MKNKKPVIAAAFANPVDRKLVADYLSGLGYDLVEFPWDGVPPADLFILDVPWARRLGRQVIELKKRTDVFLPAMIALGSRDPVDPWLDAGFDDNLRMPFTKAELKASVAILLRLRQQSRDLAQKGETKYQAVFEATGTATLLVDADTTIVMANRECLPVTGYTPQELVGTRWTDYVAPESLEMMLEFHRLRLENPRKAPRQFEARLVNKTGSTLDAVLHAGQIQGTNTIVVSILDITARKRAETALLESERFQKAILETIQDGISVLDPDLTIRHVSGVMRQWYAESLPLEGKKCHECYHHSDRPCDPCPALRAIRTGMTECNIVPGPPGSPITWIELFCYPMKDPETGKVSHIVEFVRDITERKRAEAEVERLKMAIEQTGEVILVTNPEGTIQYVNPAFTAVTGYSREEAVGQNPRLLKSGKQDPSFYRNLWETITGGRIWRGRLVNKRKDGTLYTEETTISPVKDASGQIVSFVAVKRDITEHLRLSQEQARLQEQLQQAQKLESVGRLAGGMAHDFNNMLSVILGYGEDLVHQLHPKDPLREEAKAIVEAGKRSAALTRQLLAFSRKQPLQPEVLDLNTLVRNLAKMLQRLIGEDIELELSLSDEINRAMADPGQIEQVILNLAVNARDAMPGGGNLTIETVNVELDETYAQAHVDVHPGKYVMLAVSDNGRGMDKETLARAFEPFFSTKEKGKGTGLGLSTVYGIVKQSGGNIQAYSESGRGTTFKIYLPQTEAIQESKTDAVEKEATTGGGEHVLVVEDEESLRKLMEAVLSRLGYTVTLAANGGEALLLVEEKGLKPDLILTDVVMPNISGKELVDPRNPSIFATLPKKSKRFCGGGGRKLPMSDELPWK